MIRYALNCDEGHGFESWFQNSAAYDKQAKRALVDLPGLRLCQSREGDHGAAAWARRNGGGCASDAPPAPMPPAPPAPANAPVAVMSPPERELRKKLKELRDHITKNADYVGPRFPEQARKIHYGEMEHRSIYGEASPEEAKELHEEGIDFHPLPILPDEFN